MKFIFLVKETISTSCLPFLTSSSCPTKQSTKQIIPELFNYYLYPSQDQSAFLPQLGTLWQNGSFWSQKIWHAQKSKEQEKEAERERERQVLLVFPCPIITQLKGIWKVQRGKNLKEGRRGMVATTLLGGEIFTNYMAHKGRHQQKKNVFFRAFPESPKPPPPDPSSGNLVLFFMSKTTFCAYDRKKNWCWYWRLQW